MSTPHHEADPGARRLDEAILAALFSQSPVGLHVLDTDLRMVRVNTATRLSREFPTDRMVGRRLLDMLRELDINHPELIECTARDVLATGTPVLDLRVRLRSRHDPAVEAVVSASCFRLHAPDGAVLGLATAITDITQRAKAEARLELLNRAALSVGATLDVFRTAQELCDLAVPDLADTVAVDVFDPVLRGQAPPPTGVDPSAPLRRAGFHSVADDARQGVPVVGDVGTYPLGTPHRQALSPVAPVLIAHLEQNAEWLDPVRSRDSRLLAAGVHSMMVVPLRAPGVVLGLACFYRWRNPVPFDRDDLAFTEQLASCAALRLDNARLYNRERSVARILQHELRKPDAPVSSAVETAHAYLPAGAGGGWFDVIPLSGARVALAVGDTTGDLINAPAAMGELRAAIAALSDLDLPPDEILTRLHDLASRPVREPTAATPRRETPDQTWPATCLYAVYDPVTRICALASAGHPVPTLLHASGEVEVLDTPQGPPLGQGIAHYPVTERALPPDSTVLLYNNALLDAGPHPSAARIPWDRLADVTAAPRDSLQDTCDAIVQALAPKQPHQDVVLLLARTRALDTGQTAAWTLPNNPEVAARARKLATAQLTDWDLAELADDTALIVSELVTNAVRYAEGPIELRLIRDRSLICEVTDDSSTTPQLRRANDTDEGGRGLYITAQLTDRWGVRPARRGKTIWTEQPLPYPTPTDRRSTEPRRPGSPERGRRVAGPPGM